MSWTSFIRALGFCSGWFFCSGISDACLTLAAFFGAVAAFFGALASSFVAGDGESLAAFFGILAAFFGGGGGFFFFFGDGRSALCTRGGPTATSGAGERKSFLRNLFFSELFRLR